VCNHNTLHIGKIKIILGSSLFHIHNMLQIGCYPLSFCRQVATKLRAASTLSQSLSTQDNAAGVPQYTGLKLYYAASYAKMRE